MVIFKAYFNQALKKIQNHDAQNFILGGQNKRKFIYVGQFKGSCEPPRF